MNIKGLILLFFLLAFICSNAQFASQDIDSLRTALVKAQNDSIRCFILNELVDAEPDDRLWPKYNEEVLSIAQRNLKTAKGTSKNFYLKYYGGALSNLGIIHDIHGDIPKALDYYGQGLKLQEEVGDKEGAATTLNNIAVIYQNQNELPKALDYFNRSLALRESIGDKMGISVSLSNMSVIYGVLGDIIKSVELLERSYRLQEEIGEKQGMAYTLNNLGSISFRVGNKVKALEYFTKCIDLCKEIGDKKCMALSLRNISPIFLAEKKYDLAVAYADSSLKLSKELGFPEDIFSAEIQLMRADSARGNFKGAFEHYKQYIFFRDSINNRENRKASYRNELKYEFEKKETRLKQDQLLSEEKSRRQVIIIWAALAGLILFIIFSIFIFRSLQRNKKANRIIKEKQKEILDSIHYAKRIQKALIPSDKYFDKELKRLKKD